MLVHIMLQKDSQISPLKILHLEDSSVDHELVRLALNKSREDFVLERVETLGEFEQRIEKFSFDVILADYRLPGFTALDAWQILKRQVHPPPFILLSGAIGEPA